MVFVWCQSINPFLRYDNVNIWRKWPWRSRSIDPIFNSFERVPRYTFCVNLEILARILVELLCGHARFCENWSVKVQNDLEGQGQSTPFSIASERVPRYTFCVNLEILARILVELSCGQASTYGRTDRRTDGQTDGRTEATTIPFGKICRGVKNGDNQDSFFFCLRKLIQWNLYKEIGFVQIKMHKLDLFRANFFKKHVFRLVFTSWQHGLPTWFQWGAQGVLKSNYNGVLG